MIGNDIVDLAQAKIESNWQRKGFLDKIFTELEQLYINNQRNSDIAVWSLWTRKEAAYKIFNQETRIRRYNPLCFECFDDGYTNEFLLGKVFYKDQIYFTQTQITNEYIHTIAVKNKVDFKNVLALKNSINIKKDNGIPVHVDLISGKNLPTSKSHHGDFERVVVILNPILT